MKRTKSISIRFRATGLCLGVLSFLWPAMLFAQAETRVNIRIPERAYLSYHSEIHIQISGDVLDDVLGIPSLQDAGPIQIQAQIRNETLQADAPVSPATSPPLSSIQLNIRNAWSVRANYEGQVTAILPQGQSELTGPNGSRILVQDVAIPNGQFLAKGFAAANATRGDVTLSLDLSEATEAGDYVALTPVYALIVSLD